MICITAPVPAVNWDLDSDGDGFSDKAEYLAGTDPRNARDSIAIRQISDDMGAAIIRFKTVLGKRYRLERNPDFPTCPWQNVTETDGTGEELEATDPQAPGLAKGVYRIVMLQ